jgi:acetoin utilization protein AcuC
MSEDRTFGRHYRGALCAASEVITTASCPLARGAIISGDTAFLYSDDFLKYQFGPNHPFQPIREKLTLDTLASMGVFNEPVAEVLGTKPVELNVLEKVHPASYVGFVRDMSKRGQGTLDSGDTPATRGLYEGALSVVGATVDGARGIMEGRFTHAFNPGGGLHHAHSQRASGFCVFNDIAVAVKVLQSEFGLERIAVVDIDGHHGDGTQDIFYEEPVLTMSLHRYGDGFFPGTGDVDEVGTGEGKWFNINVPLPAGTDDNLYLRAYRSIVIPALQAYQPQFIIHQFGTDGHYKDPLVGLGLTTRGYEEISRLTHDIAHDLCDGSYLVLGGGGYDIDATRRSWSTMFNALSGAYPRGSMRMDGLHDREELFADNIVLGKVLDTLELLEESSLPKLERIVRFA